MSTCPTCGHTEGERVYDAPPTFPPQCREDNACECLQCPWALAWINPDAWSCLLIDGGGYLAPADVIEKLHDLKFNH